MSTSKTIPDINGLSNEEIKERFISKFNSGATKKTYRHLLKTFFKFYEKSVFEIEAGDILDYFDSLNNNPELTITTKKSTFNCVKGFISHICWRYHRNFPQERKEDLFIIQSMFNDPTAFNWARLGHKAKKEKKPMEKEEIKEILDFLKLYDNKKYILFKTIAITGMRKGEIISIQLEREGPFGEIITLEQDLEENIIPTTGKTAYKEYPISRDSDLQRDLMQFIEYRRGINTDSNKLFINRDKTGFAKYGTTLNIYLDKTLERLGYPKTKRRQISPHLFRHTLNTLRESMNCPENVMEALMGHAPSTRTNRRYVHINNNSKVDLAPTYKPYKDLDL